MRPQFSTKACITRICREVNCITHQGRKAFSRIAVEIEVVDVDCVDFLHQPTAIVGGVVCPQFHTKLIAPRNFTFSIKIDDIANQVGHVPSVVKGCRTGGRPIFEVPCWIGGPSCSVGGVECVELITAEWNIGSIEVHNVTNHYRIVCFWKRHRPS